MFWTTKQPQKAHLNIQYPTLNPQLPIEYGDIYLDIGCSVLHPFGAVDLSY
jgi:hypothetical protein